MPQTMVANDVDRFVVDEGVVGATRSRRVMLEREMGSCNKRSSKRRSEKGGK